MSMAAELAVGVTADLTKAQQQIESGMSASGSKASKTFGQTFASGIRKAALPAAAALGLVTAATYKSVKAAEKQASANTRLQTVLASMGYAENSKAAIDLADSMEQVIAVDSATIKESMAMLGTFKDVAASSDLMGRSTKLAADLSAAGYGDMKSSAQGLGKALQDPVTGMTLLTRQGSLTRAEQKKIGDEFLRTGDKAAAQEAILAALEKQVGGVAEATADTSDKMKLGFGEISEAIGAALIPAMDALLPKITGFANWAKDNPKLLIAVGAAIATVAAAILVANTVLKVMAITQAIVNSGVLQGIAGWVAHTAALVAHTAALVAHKAITLAVSAATKAWAAVQWLLNAAMAANPIGLVVIAVAALIAVFILAWKNSETFRRIVTAAWEAIKAAADAVGKWFTKTLWPALQKVWDGIKKGVGILVDAVKKYLSVWLAVWKAAFNTIKTVTTTVFNAVKAVVQRVLAAIKAVVTTQVRGWVAVFNFLKDIVGKVTSAFSSAKAKVSQWMNTIKDFLVGRVNAAVGAFGSALRAVVGKVADVFAAVKAKVGQVMDSVKSLLSAKASALIGAFFGMAGRMAQAGRDMMMGLWNGISGIAGWVVERAKGVAASIISGVKSVFGIGSPSKVFYNIGQNNMIGLHNALVAGKTQIDRDMESLLPATIKGSADLTTAVNSTFNADTMRHLQPSVQVFIGDDQLEPYLVKAQGRRLGAAAERLIAAGV